LYYLPSVNIIFRPNQIIRAGASSPLGSPFLSKRHRFTTVQAHLSNPNTTPQQQPHAISLPSDEEGTEAAAPKKNLSNGGRTCELPTWALIGGITAGVTLALALSVDAGPAMALGPEGPLVEEFWDNMRRYGLYALTVSTGFAWALVQPIYELLRNPITAVLIIIVIAGGAVLTSQVINAMSGNSDFVYMYEQ
jgi:hypothetical protein